MGILYKLAEELTKIKRQESSRERDAKAAEEQGELDINEIAKRLEEEIKSEGFVQKIDLSSPIEIPTDYKNNECKKNTKGIEDQEERQ